MPSVGEKSKTFGNNHFLQLQHINDENVLLLALDKVKKELLKGSNVQINVPDSSEEDALNVDDQNFKARRCIYSLLKSISNNPDGYQELKSDLSKSNLSSNFKNYLDQICKAMLETQLVNRQSETTLIPFYTSSSWSVDIDLSSSYAKKLLETSITLSLELKEANGKDKSTEVIMMTAEKFSDLRFKVADALKTLQDLKKRKMFSST